MLDRYLPKLIQMTIKDFSMYPEGREIIYDFVSGINLVIGGNGIGKTTFLNLIKFSLIGLYKKDLDVRRREYNGVQIRYEGRVNLPYNYFKNRMSNDVSYNDNATVNLIFEIKNITYSVTRRLQDAAVTEFLVTQNDDVISHHGNVVSQKQFDAFLKNQEKHSDEIANSIQGIYEDIVKDACGQNHFSYLIFLLNEMLFFNEERTTILWDASFQNDFSTYFLISPKLWKNLKNAELDAKYFDSLSRKKSEDRRAVKKVLDKLKNQPDFDKSIATLHSSISDRTNEVKRLYKQLDSNQKERLILGKQITKLYSTRNKLHEKISEQESNLSKMENLHLDSVFDKVTPKYFEYLEFLKSHHDCPLCNSEIDEKKYEVILKQESSCMMCGNSIISEERGDLEDLNALRETSEKVRLSIINTQKDILQFENQQKTLDTEFHQLKLNLSKERSLLRNYEFALEKQLGKENSSSDDQFSALIGQMDELDRLKDLNAEKSKKAKEVVDAILYEIDREKLDLTLTISSVFNKFASKFLGVPCELIYYDDGEGNGKRYLPKIDGTNRESPEELSESQRFFIDQSFRMSLLAVFNKSSSFFLCETPDASLDISYERNAAQVYLEFVKETNCLVLTSNFNNSDFLSILVDESQPGKVSFINLLDYGKKSNVQRNSSQLKSASETVEKLMANK